MFWKSNIEGEGLILQWNNQKSKYMYNYLRKRVAFAVEVYQLYLQLWLKGRMERHTQQHGRETLDVFLLIGVKLYHENTKT